MLAAQLADLDPVAAELTADRLAAAQIFTAVRPLEFFHPLIGEAVGRDISAGARRVAHRRAAALLDGAGEESLARVAAHLLACGPAGDVWVVERLRDAARDALERGAPDVAADYARRALSEPPAPDERVSLTLLLGTAEWRAGQPDAITHLEQALAAASDDPGTMIVACSQLALAYSVSDQTVRAVEVIESTLAAIGNTTAELALMFEGALALTGLSDERTAAAGLRHAERLHAGLDAVADPPVSVLVASAWDAARANSAAEVEELAGRALACQPYPPSSDICPPLIIALTLVERYDMLERLCDDLIASARGRSALQETVGILVCRASALCDRGALADAEADARWALEHAAGVYRMHAVSDLILVSIERNDLLAAEEMLAQLADPCASLSSEAIRLIEVRGMLHAAQGRLREALDDFLECGVRCEALGLAMLGAIPWRGEAALVRAGLGNRQEAQQLAREQLELARAFGRPRTLGMSLRACGLVEGGQSGLELLAEAVNTLECSQSPLELARAVADYGAALRRGGHRVQARAELGRALDLAYHCGARRIAEQARAELIAAGAKPRRDAITGRDALTAGELRVARLAADGLTNREIAQALFITTKTAKAHLGRVYRKLGITRRGQLAIALSGLVDDTRKSASAAAAIS